MITKKANMPLKIFSEGLMQCNKAKLKKQNLILKKKVKLFICKYHQLCRKSNAIYENANTRKRV